MVLGATLEEQLQNLAQVFDHFIKASVVLLLLCSQVHLSPTLVNQLCRESNPQRAG